jgi:hypothetical protein
MGLLLTIMEPELKFTSLSSQNRCSKIPCGRAGGDRTHDRGIMRWEQTVELVRCCRIGPKINELFV